MLSKNRASAVVFSSNLHYFELAAIEDGVVLAELCDTSTDEDIYINNLLVERGFANDTGLRYVSQL